MHLLTPVIVIPLLIGAAITFAIGIYAWGRRPEPGVVAFLFTSIGLGAWSIFYALEILSTEIETKLFWHKLVYTMVPLVPGPWLLFLYQHNRRARRLPGWVVPALTVEPLLFIGLTWTNNWHGIIWTDVALSPDMPDLVLERSAGFWLHTAYSYLLILLATFIFMRMLWREPRLPRWQVGLLGGAALSPLLVNFIHLIGLNPLHPLDLTPFALATTGTASAWYAFRFEIWDFLPDARNAIIESMSDGAIVLDLEFTVVDINPAALRLLGIGRNAALGHPVDQILPNWAKLTQTHLPQQMSGAQAPWELELQGPDGARYMDLVYSRLYDRADRLTGSLLTLRDVTQRRRAEQALAQERTLLAQRVAEQTADLRKANAELARAAKMKDEFLASMSHELRTPLNTVLGLSEALQEQVYGVLNQRQVRALGHIEESGRHLLALINDVLDVSKIEAGRLTLDLRPVPVSDVCQASVALIRQMAHQKRIEITFTPDPAVHYLLADERRIKQILVNLLSNAVKFTPESGQVGIALAGDAANEVVRFVVWDTGIGISPADMERLFQPFVQLDSSLARHQDGSGLGLALVYRMVALHGGSVSVESTVGQGSRFTVALPWRHPDFHPAPVEEAQTPVHSLQDGETPSAQSPLVLLVEDNETNIRTLMDYLLATGHRVESVRSGNTALQYLCSDPSRPYPDIILMDIQMPGIDGLTVIRRLREDADLRTIPIIALTALAMPGDREKVLAAGADEYMSKPVSLKHLARVIATCLQHTRG